jgi:hypothetical protein
VYFQANARFFLRDAQDRLRLFCRNSMNYWFKFSALVKADGRPSYALFRPQNVLGAVAPWSPQGMHTLAGGNAPGKRTPKQVRPRRGQIWARSHRSCLPPAPRSATPPGSGVEGHTFRGRCPRLLSGALAGREN